MNCYLAADGCFYVNGKNYNELSENELKEFKIYENNTIKGNKMKIIRKQEADATSMTRLEYNKFRGWKLPDDENGNDKGYKLVSGDHVSWIPEEIFQKECVIGSNSKSLGNTDANGATKNVEDIQFWGEGDNFKLISKASSQNEAWMKSTKSMEIEGVGCVVQVTTQQGDNVAEAVTFVPGVKIEDIIETDDDSDDGKIIGRRLVSVNGK